MCHPDRPNVVPKADLPKVRHLREWRDPLTLISIKTKGFPAYRRQARLECRKDLP